MDRGCEAVVGRTTWLWSRVGGDVGSCGARDGVMPIEGGKSGTHAACTALRRPLIDERLRWQQQEGVEGLVDACFSAAADGAQEVLQ